MTDPSYRRHNSTQTLNLLDELTEVYAKIRSGFPEYSTR